MICRDCYVDLPDEAFSWRKKEVIRNTICRGCQKVRQRAWYDKNSETHKTKSRAHAKRVYLERRAKLDQIKSVPCLDCHRTFPPYVMDFDHLNDKLFNVSAMLADGRSWELIETEIAKCEIICANCHRIRTWRRNH